MNIKEASEYLHIPKETLRYWEANGLIPPVPRNRSGYRAYTEKELRWALFIKAMRNAGMSVESLIEFVRLYRSHRDTWDEQKAVIREQYDSLLHQRDDLNQTLKYLKYKLDHYEDHILPFLEDQNYYSQHRKTVTKDKKQGRHQF